ncbi:GatB/YqeY domain-containing protein [Marinobacterium sp. D7]|uniref:GatB/YqeY domain-containing protein n=1 Tax=Marinobacterium ramblicola TaxID=2849041 RepID=UPI001C2DE37B|nr:GatB/YqeY domain-containing protein [Marinobacterium ramblicola]MBV1790212.1 GatB/YqeY domain-containing protein [Marinobacterium ramblicola]
MSDLKAQITEQMKDAMRAKDKARLGTIRLILADIKRIEVDERIELDDARVLQVLDKMVKQRRDSIAQYLAAERPELADKEQQELEVIKTFLPQPLSDEEINAILDDAIASTGASSMADMGKVMGIVKPKIQGRADMGVLSNLVKSKLVKAKL